MAADIGSIRFQYEPLRETGAASIIAGAGAFVTMGTPVANAVRAFYILNDTDGILIYSIDGVNDHFVTAPDSFILFDVCTNQTFTNGFFISQGTQFWVRQSLAPFPTTGTVFLTIVYGAP